MTRTSLAARRLAAVLGLVALGAGCRSTRSPSPGTGTIAVDIATASAQRLDDGEVLFRLTATLDNATGRTLTMQTNFASVFDGMSLVVVGTDGRELARQSYVYHQSPYWPDGSLAVPLGRTTKEIVFPIRDLSRGAFAARLRLEGGLPGTTYAGGIVSNTVDVAVPAGPGAAGEHGDAGATQGDGADAAPAGPPDAGAGRDGATDARPGPVGFSAPWPTGVPRPPGVTKGDAERSGRGDRLIRFEAQGDFAAAWKAWSDGAAAVGWQVADPHGGDRLGWRSASLFSGSPEGPRAAMVLWSLGAGNLAGQWSDAPALGERPVPAPPGDCVPIPHPSFRIITHVLGDFHREGRELEDTFGTLWLWDLDGDGTLDALAPVTEGAYCADDTSWTIYIARGPCGHDAGTIQGRLDWDALRRAPPGPSGLPDLTTVAEVRGAWPGPEGLGALEVHTTKRTYRYDGTRYALADTTETRERETCSPGPCAITTCTGIIDVQPDGSSYAKLQLPKTLDGDALERGQEAARPAVAACTHGRGGNVVALLTLDGATGRVTAIDFDGSVPGAARACLRRAIQATVFDRFADPSMQVSLTWVPGDQAPAAGGAADGGG